MPFILIAFIILGGAFLVILYNRLVTLSNARDGAFANIDVELRKRRNLVERLVNTVSTYMGHEDKVLTELTRARAQAEGSSDLEQRLEAETKVGNLLDQLKLTVENYPDLKANQNFLNLQDELKIIESEVARTRKEFNSLTRDYNTLRMQWPASMVAKWNNFGPVSYFSLSEEERKSLTKPAGLEF